MSQEGFAASNGDLPPDVQRCHAIYYGLRALRDEDREAYLEAACGCDASLRQEVEALVHASPEGMA